MKFDLNPLRKRGDDDERRPPSRLFGSRIRTSTLVLIVAFFALWWTYATYRPDPEPTPSNTPPSSQVVPPGFVPDPNYTWVPRTRVRQQPTTQVTTPPSSTTDTDTSTPEVPPPLPCLLPPPFCPATTTPEPEPEPSVSTTPSVTPSVTPSAPPPAG